MKTREGAWGILVVAMVLTAGIATAGSFDIRDYGAAGDGRTKDTAAVQRAIDAAEAAGGGEVLLSAGTYLCGTVYLKDNIDFHLEAGAVLKGSVDREDYCAADFVPQNWASSREGDNTSGGHLVVAVGRRNVTLRGPGKIDGSGPGFLLDGNGRQWEGWKKGIPWRPGQMVWICDCSDVRIVDLELADSPYWTCNLLNCERVGIRGCYVHNERNRFHTWNGDGIDIDRCRHVTVSDCRVDTTDDCITLRASCAKRLAEPKDCAFVTVENCSLSSSCNAIRVGVGEGRIHDAVLRNLTISDTGYAFNFVGAYSPKNRGTDICGIRVSNVRLEARQFLWMHHRHSTEAFFDDISFDGISGTVQEPSLIDAKPTRPFRRIGFTNVNVPLGVRVSNADVEIAGGTFFAAEEEEKFVPLFNGRDLAGWEGATNTYCVTEDGLLTCTQRDGAGESGQKNLWTVRDYTNFVIRFDVKLPSNANNGLGIRCPANGWCSREGIELQLLDDWGDLYNGSNKLVDVHYTGSIYGVVPPARKLNGESYLSRPGEWNSVEARADGPRIAFVLNGVKIVDADVSKFSTDGTVPADGIRRPGLHNAFGRIHWCGHGHNIFWRNIRIRELP